MIQNRAMQLILKFLLYTTLLLEWPDEIIRRFGGVGAGHERDGYADKGLDWIP